MPDIQRCSHFGESERHTNQKTSTHPVCLLLLAHQLAPKDFPWKQTRLNHSVIGDGLLYGLCKDDYFSKGI